MSDFKAALCLGKLLLAPLETTRQIPTNDRECEIGVSQNEEMEQVIFFNPPLHQKIEKNNQPRSTTYSELIFLHKPMLHNSESISLRPLPIFCLAIVLNKHLQRTPRGLPGRHSLQRWWSEGVIQKHISLTTKLSFASPGLTHYKGWSPNSLRMMLEFCPLEKQNLFKTSPFLPPTSSQLLPENFWPPFLVSVPYIQTTSPRGMDCRTSLFSAFLERRKQAPCFRRLRSTAWKYC